jgi:hypothetical protein
MKTAALRANAANSASCADAGTKRARRAPANEPIIASAPNPSAMRTLIVPWRQCVTNPTRALMPTTTRLIAMAGLAST